MLEWYPLPILRVLKYSKERSKYGYFKSIQLAKYSFSCVFPVKSIESIGSRETQQNRNSELHSKDGAVRWGERLRVVCGRHFLLL
jgi:hypothetical protein